MAWTTEQFVAAAYRKIGMADYVFDLEPEQLQSAGSELHAMLAEWNAMGIRIGFPVSSNPDSISQTQNTGAPDSATVAIYSNLAVRLAPDHGKTPSPILLAQAANGYRAMVKASVNVIPVAQPASMIAGQGHRRYRDDRTFLDPPADVLAAGSDKQIDDLEL